MTSGAKEPKRKRLVKAFGKLLGAESDSAPEPAAVGKSGTSAVVTEVTQDPIPDVELPKKIDTDEPHADLSTDQPDESGPVRLKWHDLWEEAFRGLAKDAPDVMDDYKKYLKKEFAPDNAVDDILVNSEYVKSIIQKLEEIRAEQQFRVRFSSSLINFDTNVREQGERLLKFTIWSDEIVKTALSSQPYAGLAWCGATMVLPLIKDLMDQHNDMIEGFETISRIQSYWKVCGDTCLEASREDAFQNVMGELVKLYSQILRYQAQVITHLSKPQYKRAVSNPGWKGFVQAISTLDASAEKLVTLLDPELTRSKLQQQVEEVQNSNKILEEIRLLVQQSSERRKRKDESEFLKSFSSKDRGSLDDIKSRIAGTCEWFFDEEKYTTWRDMEKSGVLWVSAGPGCGKSVLAKTLIDEGRLSRNRSTVVSYFFFKDSVDGCKTKEDALCATLYRLFMADTTGELLESTMNLRNVTANKSLNDNFSDLWAILRHCAYSRYSGDIICVIDALDECILADREKFLKELDKFFSQMNAVDGSVKLKFFITCRPYDYFKEENLVRLFPKLAINTAFIPFSDVSGEIDLVIDARVNQLANKFTREVREGIVAKLRHMKDRTFLWLHLTFKYIEEHPESFRKAKDFAAQLDKLPEDVSDAYNKLLDKVTRSAAEKKRAESLLQIVFAAPRPLTVLEANYAITLAMSEEHFDSYQSLVDDLYVTEEIGDMVKVWSGFMIDVYDEKLFFIHQTVREFLDPQQPQDEDQQPTYWRGIVKRHNPHNLLAKICTKYQLLPEFDEKEEWNHFERWDKFERRVNWRFEKSYPFHKFADLCWPTSFEAQDATNAGDSMSQALKVCNISRPHLNDGRWPECEDLPDSESIATKRLYVACLINAPRIVSHILQSSQAINCNVKDSSGLIPLEYALYCGYATVVQYLVADERVDCGIAKPPPGKFAYNVISPFHIAIRYNHIKVVEVLCKADRVDVNAAIGNREPPLLYACKISNLEIIKIIIETKGINLKVEAKGDSALTMAVLNEYHALPIVDYLLNTAGFDVNHITTTGKSALMTALYWNRTDVAQKLVKTDGIKIGLANSGGETALIIIARNTSMSRAKRNSMIELYCELDGINPDASLKSGKSIREWLRTIHKWRLSKETFDAFRSFNQEVQLMRDSRGT